MAATDGDPCRDLEATDRGASCAGAVMMLVSLLVGFGAGVWCSGRRLVGDHWRGAAADGGGLLLWGMGHRRAGAEVIEQMRQRATARVNALSPRRPGVTSTSMPGLGGLILQHSALYPHSLPRRALHPPCRCTRGTTTTTPPRRADCPRRRLLLQPATIRSPGTMPKRKRGPPLCGAVQARVVSRRVEHQAERSVVPICTVSWAGSGRFTGRRGGG